MNCTVKPRATFIAFLKPFGIIATVPEIAFAIQLDGLFDKRVTFADLHDTMFAQISFAGSNQICNFIIKRGVVSADAQTLFCKVKHVLHLAG